VTNLPILLTNEKGHIETLKYILKTGVLGYHSYKKEEKERRRELYIEVVDS
jgi:hypothetical protein